MADTTLTITLPEEIRELVNVAAAELQPIRDIPDKEWTPSEGETAEDRPSSPQYTLQENTYLFIEKWLTRQLQLGLNRKAQREGGGVEVPDVNLTFEG